LMTVSPTMGPHPVQDANLRILNSCGDVFERL